ncbi:Sugar transferase involved in LPS biosynthesis (colanic, teichoic acid) [Allgaiera indica]|nr:Sugar transferase involved in LPS biosynthesis (colanic, teichoic acid) [Allgaiera indica]
MHLPDLYDSYSILDRQRRNRARRTGLYRGGVKRMIDVSLVLISLPLVAPMLAILALLVARDGHSPFYWNRRVGRGGRVFHMLKLRTMVPDADRKLQEHLDNCPAAAAEWSYSQKLRNDPRVTRVGRFLRKCSLDELPQIWNVLRGDMSLVGPRPIMPNQAPLYPGTAYFNLRPGLTGPWQVSDRHESAFVKRAEYDARYEAELSLATDTRLIVRTLGVVMRGTGC